MYGEVLSLNALDMPYIIDTHERSALSWIDMEKEVIGDETKVNVWEETGREDKGGGYDQDTK